jgi:hypothetical protein
MSREAEVAKDPDEGKTIPDQLYKIAEESEGGAAQVMDQVEISINNFEEIKSLAMSIMELVSNSEEETVDEVMTKAEEIISYAENGLQNLDGILDLYQYQDITRQKLEKVGHQLIDVSEYIRQKLVPDVTQLAHIPPSGKDILDRDIDDHDGKVGRVDDIIADFLKNKV